MNQIIGIILLFSIICMISLCNISINNTTLAISYKNTDLIFKPIYHSEGKIVEQRIIENGSEGWKQQVSYQGKGNFSNGDPTVSENWTFINNHRSDGVIQGEGNGVLKVLDNNGTRKGDMIIKIKGYGRGYHEPNGQITFYPTSQLYDTPLNYNGTLAFLNKIIGIAIWKVNLGSNTYDYTMYSTSDR